MTTAKAKATTDRHENLAAALAAFQADMPTVHKGKTANMGQYTYKYADLADVASAAHPILARHGLSFTAQPRHVEGVGFVLVGVLRHESGETDEGMLPIQGRDAQGIGSSLTYNRRYLLGCMTGIVTDEDDDGARAARARTERPASDVQGAPEPPPAERQGGTRQQGRTQPPAEPAQGPDTTVVRAHVIAATKAGNLETLRDVWQQAVAAGTFGSAIVDPDTTDRDAPQITLGEFLTRKRSELEAAA